MFSESWNAKKGRKEKEERREERKERREKEERREEKKERKEDGRSEIHTQEDMTAGAINNSWISEKRREIEERRSREKRERREEKRRKRKEEEAKRDTPWHVKYWKAKRRAERGEIERGDHGDFYFGEREDEEEDDSAIRGVVKEREENDSKLSTSSKAERRVRRGSSSERRYWQTPDPPQRVREKVAEAHRRSEEERKGTRAEERKEIEKETMLDGTEGKEMKREVTEEGEEEMDAEEMIRKDGKEDEWRRKEMEEMKRNAKAPKQVFGDVQVEEGDLEEKEMEEGDEARRSGSIIIIPAEEGGEEQEQRNEIIDANDDDDARDGDHDDDVKSDDTERGSLHHTPQTGKRVRIPMIARSGEADWIRDELIGMMNDDDEKEEKQLIGGIDGDNDYGDDLEDDIATAEFLRDQDYSMRRSQRRSRRHGQREENARSDRRPDDNRQRDHPDPKWMCDQSNPQRAGDQFVDLNFLDSLGLMPRVGASKKHDRAINLENRAINLEDPFSFGFSRKMKQRGGTNDFGRLW